MNEIVSILDIGSGWIKGLAVTIKDSETLEIESVNDVKVESKGIEKGNIVRTSLARASIKEAVENLSNLSSFDLRSFYLLINHPKIKFSNVKVELDLRTEANNLDDSLPQVEERHLEELKRLVKEQAQELGYEIIHIIPRYYVLDGEKNYEPVGLYATKIEAYYHVIKIKKQVVLNLNNLMRSLNYKIKRIMFPAFVASFEVLSEDDTKKDVLILDLGHTTCGFCYFVEGSPYVSGALPLGIRDIVEAIAINYKIPLKEAKKIFEEVGYHKVQGFSVEGEDEVIQTFREDGTPISIAKQEISLFLREGISEILEDTLKTLHKEGVNIIEDLDEIILIGGGANIKNIKELMEELLDDLLNVSVRLGSQKDLSLDENIEIGYLDNLGNEFSASLGAVVLIRQILQRGFGLEEESSSPFELDKDNEDFYTAEDETYTSLPPNEEQEKKGFFTKFLSFFKNLISED